MHLLVLASIPDWLKRHFISTTYPSSNSKPSSNLLSSFLTLVSFSTSGLTALLNPSIPSTRSDWIEFNDMSKIITGNTHPCLLYRTALLALCSVSNLNFTLPLLLRK